MKRAFDIILAILGLILLIPLFLVLSILIKCESKGPAFFKQDRIGKNGKVFKMYKFRSMVVDAEKMGAGLFNFKGDPRVTKIGRFLRDSSLDELPQLINIIKGDLSFVGPRPPVVYELGDFATLNKTFKRRFEIKPGITGYAQVQGRNEIPWNIKVKYDNEYIEKFKKYGILIDLEILRLTVINVFASKNIYEEKIDDSLDDAEAAALAEQEVIRIAHMEEPEDETVKL